MNLNKYQTPIEELTYTHVDEKTGEQALYTWDTCPEEVREEFLDYVNTIPFINHLISADRPPCKDLPRDEKGKAIYDITNPPIIEDTDYFRPVALHYKKTGRFTDLRPNPAPNSAYKKWLDEEKNRIYNGYLREEDGAWIPGDMYWLLNYTPMIITKAGENENVGDRVTDAPEFWEGILWRMIGWYDARRVGQNFAEIAKRGASKSYSIAAKLSKTLILGNKPLKPEEIATKKPQNAKAGLVAYDKQYLTKTDGTLNKFEQDIDFCAINTEFPRKRLQSSLHDMAWEMGYIDLNTGAKVGTRNAVVGVSVGDDIDKIRGKRQEFIGFEEFGKFPNLSDAYNVSLKSVKEGNRWFGTIVLIGTGGEEGADFSGALDMIYHPTGFFMRAYQNVWDKSTQTKGYSIFFFPAYVNRAGCYNKDGISDVTKALFAICCDRYIAKYHNPDPMQLTRTKAEDPVTIQDAIMRRDGSKFPAAQITERIVEIDLNPNFYDTMYVGTLTQNSRGEVEFRPTAEAPIRKFPHKDNKIIGAFEISALPQRNKEGKVYSNRYIASCDPVDDDESNTMSLVSFFILDLWTDSIVCEWTGRDSSAEACYERVRLGCIFYNATLCYENDKKGLFSYFKMMNCLYLLAPTPEYLKDKENIGSEPLNNKYYGVKATAGVNAYARDRLKDWMLIPTTVVKTIDGVEQEVTVPKIMTVWNRAFLEEARQWNPDGNFDRISSMGMLMLLREERLVKFGSLDNLRQERDSKTYKGNDSFFERNYKPRRKK